VTNFPSGSGGGKKRQESPTVAETTGISTDYAQVLMALGEGQIEGIKGNAQGVFLDDTPLQNQDGTFNFQDMTYNFVPGTLNQSIPASANEVSSETTVNVEVKSSIPITRSIINNQVNAIRLRLGFNLQFQDDSGNVSANTVRVRILLKEGTGAFIIKTEQDIFGRFPNLTVFQWTLPVNTINGTVDSFSVKVEKLTPDSTETSDVKKVQFLSYAEVIWDSFEYPNTALVWMQFPSSLFKSVPSLKFELGGLLYPIPTNATVDPINGGLNYSGGWTGGFYTPAIAPADPCWLIHELIVNPRFGLGRQLRAEDVDKWALYSASQYNNQPVPDGFGLLERRYLFNGVIQGNQDAWEVITAICSNFDAKPFWNGSTISFWQDRPTTALSKIFTNADVEEGRFVYTSREWKSIATVARVTWNNPDEQYERSVEVVEDPQGIEKYGVHYVDFTAFGCTSRGQAVRAGRRTLLKSRLDQEQVSFKARAIAVFCQPGDVIMIADNRRIRARKGGIISSATTTSITVDSPVSLIGTGFKVFVTMPDLTVQERNLVNPPGTHTVLHLSSALPSAPLTHSNWIVQDFSSVLRKYRVIGVAPDPSNPVMYEITGEIYSEEKHPLVEAGWTLDNLPAANKPPRVAPLPRAVAASALVITQGSSKSYTLLVSWEFALKTDGNRDGFVTAYYVEFKRGTGAWGNRQKVATLEARFENIGSGTFYARVASLVEGWNRVSQWVSSNAVTIVESQYVADFSISRTSVLATDF